MKHLFFCLLAASLSGCATVSRFEQGTTKIYSFRHDSTNAHLVVQGKNMVLVDSGYEENAEKLEQDIRDEGYDPAVLRAVILTHGHADHAGGALHFQKKFGTKIVAGAGDRDMMAAGKNEKLCSTGFLGSIRHSTDQAGSYTPTKADVWVNAPGELSLMTLAGLEGRVIALPGHTRGSLVVTVGDAVFVGDLFRGSLLGSGAETHFYMCDVEGNRRDVARLLHEIAPHGQTFFVGHFGPVDRVSVAEHFAVPNP